MESQLVLPVNRARDGTWHNFPVGGSTRTHTEHGIHLKLLENVQILPLSTGGSIIIVAVHTVSPGQCLEEPKLVGDKSTGMMPSLSPLGPGPGPNGRAGSFLFTQEVISGFTVVEKSIWAVVIT